jgi:two-component system phosphate regulon sensor histidine kinase PhoR
MGISLTGIILLQLFWIRNAISIREEHFNKSVNIALAQTAEKLTSHENILLLSDRFYTHNKHGLLSVEVDSASDALVFQHDSAASSSYTYNIRQENDRDVVLSVWTENDDEVQVVEYKHEVKIDSLRRNVSRVKADIDIDSISKFITHDIVFVGEDGEAHFENMEDGYVVVKRAQDLNEAFIKMAYAIESKPMPIEERIDTVLVAEVLASTLFNNGIHIPFEFGVLKLDTGRSIAISSAEFDRKDIDARFMVSLFPNELQDVSNFLILQFPGRNVHILKSMAWTLSGSLLLTLIILVTFAITIFMILRQKKLADIKSDFINNLTHEFKTPIATIGLAVDSINSPKIINQEKEIRYYTDIIREENKRMNMQVESVLRMSLLDKHELEFNFIESDLHELIQNAISKAGLLLKEKNGNIEFKADSIDPIANIDPDHFTNAMLNLLDNAIKYSEDKPEIIVSTEDSDGDILIAVTDKGIGMNKDVQQKVFEKFYRKNTGNIHNIKGFGLGLSYVKAIADAFRGSISVRSETGKGSTFILRIPKK